MSCACFVVYSVAEVKMGEYRQAEAIIISCEKHVSIIYTTVKIELYDDTRVVLSYPRAPASLILREDGKIIWRFDFHKAIKTSVQELTFETYTEFNDLPVLGHKYIFQRWWTPDQLDIVQSNTFDWERKIFAPPHLKWDHEHCIICWKRFSEYEDEQHFGYVRFNVQNQEDWLCEKCYNEYIVSGFGRKLGDDIG